MKILLAVDGSPCSDEAIAEVARRPWPAGSEIEVIAAFELVLPPSPDAWAIPPSYLADLDRIASEHAGKLVDQVANKLRTASLARNSHKKTSSNDGSLWHSDSRCFFPIFA